MVFKNLKGLQSILILWTSFITFLVDCRSKNSVHPMFRLAVEERVVRRDCAGPAPQHLQAIRANLALLRGVDLVRLNLTMVKSNSQLIVD